MRTLVNTTDARAIIRTVATSQISALTSRVLIKERDHQASVQNTIGNEPNATSIIP